LGFTSSILGHTEVASIQLRALEELHDTGLGMDLPGTFSVPVAASLYQALLTHVAGDEGAADVHLANPRMTVSRKAALRPTLVSIAVPYFELCTVTENWSSAGDH
jgi:hypothetical protein